jgi:thiamine-monophosphate kinase
MVEGVHFLGGQDLEDVAWKLVASNASDLAAKGAQPFAALLSYQLGGDDLAFVRGLKAALHQYGDAALLGGDTVGEAGPKSVGLTLIGRATHYPVPSRAGAIPGDEVWITGPIGAAMVGFEALKSGIGDSTAYRRPVALLAEGQHLAPLVSAMMDVSDGLLLDARRLAEASGVTISLDRAAVPVAGPEECRGEALIWGDDYQLLFTATPSAALPKTCTLIGIVLAAGPEPLLLDGVPPTGKLGYEHG